MWELCEIYRNNLAEKERFVERIIPIRIENISLNAPKTHSDYLRYGNGKFEEWNQFIAEFPQQVGRPQLDEFQKTLTIKDQFGAVTDYFNDMNAQTLKLIRNDDFETVKNLIIQWLKGGRGEDWP